MLFDASGFTQTLVEFSHNLYLDTALAITRRFYYLDVSVPATRNDTKNVVIILLLKKPIWKKKRQNADISKKKVKYFLEKCYFS